MLSFEMKCLFVPSPFKSYVIVSFVHTTDIGLDLVLHHKYYDKISQEALIGGICVLANNAHINGKWHT